MDAGPSPALKMRATPLRICVVLFAWSALAVGCNSSHSQAHVAKVPQVLVSMPVSREITDQEDFVGRTEAVATVEVRAHVTGYLDKVLFREGEDVKEGEDLFVIDQRQYKAELARAEANLVQNESHRKRLESDYQRALSLLAKKAIGQEEFDKIAGDLAEAQAGSGSARASVDIAKLNLIFTRITAPISGRSSRKLIDPGNLVKADTTPLTTIVSLDPMHVHFDIDERTVLRIRRLLQETRIKANSEAGIPVFLGLADEEGFSLEGAINFEENQFDAGTGTLRARAVFPNPNCMLAPGMFVRVRLIVGTAYKAVLVAEQALGTDQAQKFLYVVNDKDEVEYRKVRTGPLNNGQRVILEGLQANERVIVTGLQRVRPNAKVIPQVIEMPAGTGAILPTAILNRKKPEKKAALALPGEMKKS